MKDNLMQRMLFAAVMTAISELEDFRENENFNFLVDKGISFNTVIDDIDVLNERKRLYNILLMKARRLVFLYIPEGEFVAPYKRVRLNQDLTENAFIKPKKTELKGIIFVDISFM